MDKGRVTTLVSDLGLLIVACCTLLGISLDPNFATAIATALVLTVIAILDVYHPEYKDLIDIEETDDVEELDGRE